MPLAAALGVAIAAGFASAPVAVSVGDPCAPAAKPPAHGQLRARPRVTAHTVIARRGGAPCPTLSREAIAPPFECTLR